MCYGCRTFIGRSPDLVLCVNRLPGLAGNSEGIPDYWTCPINQQKTSLNKQACTGTFMLVCSPHMIHYKLNSKETQDEKMRSRILNLLLILYSALLFGL